jgi:hypothetical protein
MLHRWQNFEKSTLCHRVQYMPKARSRLRSLEKFEQKKQIVLALITAISARKERENTERDARLI